MINNNDETNHPHEEIAATILETNNEVEETNPVLLASLHKIDRDLQDPIFREVNTEDAEVYVAQLIQETVGNPNRRGYKFNATSPVSSFILDIFNKQDDESIKDIFNANCTNIAIRLLLAEKRSVQKYPSMNAPRKGSLIITSNKNNECVLITIAKIETADFLEDVNLQLQSGLPIDKKALKTAIIKVTELGTDVEMEITVTDSSSGIAKYWTDEFLEVTEITSDEQNTKNAFNHIEKVLSQNLKKQAPSDYTELRNNLVGYFKTQTAFQYDELINQVFGTYTFDNPEVSLDDIKEKVNKLVQKEKFDTHFTLVPSEIKARFKKTYKVSDEIELRTNGHIEGLRHIIKATTNTIGEKILEIKVENDTIYKEFEFNHEENEN